MGIRKVESMRGHNRNTRNAGYQRKKALNDLKMINGQLIKNRLSWQEIRKEKDGRGDEGQNMRIKYAELSTEIDLTSRLAQRLKPEIGVWIVNL